MFTVSQQSFAGPLDMLLSLIEKEELDVTTVSLAKVTDQYLAYVADLEQQNLDDLTDFLVIAARLLVLKSRVLIPEPSGDEPEPEDDLAERLMEYKMIREVSRVLGTRLTDSQISFAKPPADIEMSPQFVPAGITINQLANSFAAIIERLPDEAPPEVDVLDANLSLEECIQRVRQTLATGTRQFDQLFSGLRSKLAMIVTFLAVLELIKQQALLVTDPTRLTLQLREA